MKLGIFCNFSYKHVGGSENVIKNISDRLVNDFDYEVNVYSFSVNAPFYENKVRYFPCKKGDGLFAQIAQNDHIFIYSDSFWQLDTLLQNIDKIDCRASLALVGAYHLQSHPESFRLLKENIEKFNLITHSETTPDYKWCIDNNLPVKVVPNGVDLSEFWENRVNFREKYKIKEKYIILSVFSYFFGKGFEILPKIAEKLSEHLDDFLILQCSNTSQYPYDKPFFERTKKQSRGLPIRFLRDIPREDIVSAFNCSDVFLSPSKKEVAPIVILECRAAKLPYVSFAVGNVGEQGGIPLIVQQKDNKGYAIVEKRDIDHFSAAILQLLTCKDERYKNIVIEKGQHFINNIDWDNIVLLYDREFRHE